MDAVHVEASILQPVYTVFIKPPLHHLHSLLPAKQELMHCPLAELAGRENTSLNVVILMAGKETTSCLHSAGQWAVHMHNT